MNKVKTIKYIGRLSLIILAIAICSFRKEGLIDNLILSHTVNLKQQKLEMYWKNDKGGIIGSLANLNSYITDKHKTLVFAMNGGMYKEDNSPLGLYIENGKQIKSLNTDTGYGNFYMMPNGIFFITENKQAVIMPTNRFKPLKNIKFATQSGPMLVIDGEIHPSFKEGSMHTNIRNGVGILPDGQVLFAMSKSEINFYDFATWFKNKGCTNALYLDGFVSRTYLPSKNWKQTDGNFGVIIAETK